MIQTFRMLFKASLILSVFVATMNANAFSGNQSPHLSTTTTVTAAANSEESSSVTDTNDGEIPRLPPPDLNAKGVPTLKLGEKMSFDFLGPVIINADGTTRAIANWDEMSEHEREVTWRRISARNEQRREALLKKQLEDQQKQQK